ALAPAHHRPEVLAQRVFGFAVEVDEDEAFPDVAVDGDEAVVVLVEVEELAFLLDEGAAAVEVVAPAVVLARELAAGAADFFAGVVVPHEFVAAVAADVVEGAHGAVAVAYDDD